MAKTEKTMAEERLTYADEHAMRERDGETWPDRAAAISDRRALLAELDALRADLARVTGERDAMQAARAQTMGANEAALSAAEKERDDERAKANEWLAQAHDARAQLAALHAAASGASALIGWDDGTAGQNLDAALADTAAAAKAFVEATAARAVAGVTEELGAMRSGYETVRADRDYHCDRAIALASALAEVREKATPLLDPRQVDGYALERAALRDALSALPADLAAQRDARVRAEALREAEALALGYGREVGDDHAWASNTADEIARLISERADEAERGGR